MNLSSLEICTGAGGQALGLEQAGFRHVAVAEIDRDACATLRTNRPAWPVIEGDIRDLSGRRFTGIDLLAGGPNCTPFTIGGRQLGAADARDLFPEALRLITEARPRAVMLENVPGLASQKFTAYRDQIACWLIRFGYRFCWRLVLASEFGVPQRRSRLVLVAFRRPADAARFCWPVPLPGWSGAPLSAGAALRDLMAGRGWPGAGAWAAGASAPAPALAGGSHLHGGPDLGPTRAKRAWGQMGVCGYGIADAAPGPSGPDGADLRRTHNRHQHPDSAVMLTLRCGARLQGFPDSWGFCGGKTSVWRQVGNALPPPVAQVFGTAIAKALSGGCRP